MAAAASSRRGACARVAATALLPLLLLLACVLRGVGVEARSVVPRIIGGSPMVAGSFLPYQAALIRSNSDGTRTLTCTAVILSASYIATACHCFYSVNSTLIDISQFMIGAGGLTWSTLPQLIAPAQLFMCPGFALQTLQNDICVLRLTAQLTLDGTSAVAARPYAGSAITTFGYGFAMGWGLTVTGGQASNVLLGAQLSIWSLSDCATISRALQGVVYDPAKQFCAGGNGSGRDVCHGDSGGPIGIVGSGANGTVVAGLVSWVTNPCNYGKGASSGYSLLSAQRAWLDSVVPGIMWQSLTSTYSGGAPSPRAPFAAAVAVALAAALLLQLGAL